MPIYNDLLLCFIGGSLAPQKLRRGRLSRLRAAGQAVG